MNVDFYEKIWMWAAAGLIALFLGAIVFAAGSHAVHPPSHIETIDPVTVYDDPEFGNPGVTLRDDGGVLVVGLAEMFFFDPDPIRVPAGRPVTFRLTSADVIHGFEVVGTNANVMIIPGYVTEFTVTFHQPGKRLVLCNEYCGLLHQQMVAQLIVEEETP